MIMPCFEMDFHKFFSGFCIITKHYSSCVYIYQKWKYILLIYKHHLIFIQKVQCNDKGPLERSSCKVIVQNYIRFSLYLFMYYNLQIFSLIKHSLNSFHLSHVYLIFLVLHFFQTLFDIHTGGVWLRSHAALFISKMNCLYFLP